MRKLEIGRYKKPDSEQWLEIFEITSEVSSSVVYKFSWEGNKDKADYKVLLDHLNYYKYTKITKPATFSIWH